MSSWLARFFSGAALIFTFNVPSASGFANSVLLLLGMTFTFRIVMASVYSIAFCFANEQFSDFLNHEDNDRGSNDDAPVFWIE